jgi:FtsH-binding integral membrane protein
MACSFSPSSVPSGSASASTVLTISTMPVTVAVLHQPGGQIGSLLHIAGLFVFGLVGLLITRRIDRSRMIRVLGASTAVVTILMLSSCGGNMTPPQVHSLGGASAGTYTIVINAVSGSTQASSSESVTVQ